MQTFAICKITGDSSRRISQIPVLYNPGKLAKNTKLICPVDFELEKVGAEKKTDKAASKKK
jgi:hypothetical protein